jgi:hypothetical protein
MRYPFAARAHATYEVQLHMFIFQRSTAPTIPAWGHREAYG